MRRIWLVLLALGLLAVGIPAGGVAAAPPGTCTAQLLISTTSPGAVSTAGPVTLFRDSGVGGQYVAGFLAGYTIAGTQDIELNAATQQAQLRGSFVATGPGGTLTVRYTGHADLTTGAASGRFVTTAGTGQFAGFHWAGAIEAQLVGPLTFLATDTGPCG